MNHVVTFHFNEASDVEKETILREFYFILHQSHPTKADIEKGVELSGLKATYTPCVVMLKKPFSEACQKILVMPKNEWIKSFRLWVGVFSISDLRRRETDCKNGCSHEWHNIQKS